jgi:outer membrane protein assembly factor BamD (BamD/ComL family)
LKSKNYDDALEKFKQITARYPLTPIAADARLDLAQTYIKTAIEADGDISLIHAAHRDIIIFLKQNPQHPRLEEAKKVLTMAESMEAEQLLYLGEFYQRKSHKRSSAARRYLNEVVAKYPNTKSARKAKELLVEVTPEYDPTDAVPATDAESPSQLPVDIN